MLRRYLLLSWFAAALLAPSAGPPVPETPAPVDGLIYARPFVLEAGFVDRWSAERPLVTDGWILVLDVDPMLGFPRETAEPVLYAGRRTAQRISRGWPAGRVVALVPGPIDWETDPVWFGAPELPERIDATIAAAERARALAAGIGPFDAGQVSRALAAGGPALAVVDGIALQKELHTLYERYVVPRMPD